MCPVYKLPFHKTSIRVPTHQLRGMFDHVWSISFFRYFLHSSVQKMNTTCRACSNTCDQSAVLSHASPAHILVWRAIFFACCFLFGWLWLLASAFGFWLLASGFWLLAFGFFWLLASGFCGFWLGCNSAWILFIVCTDLLYMLYISFFFRPWVSFFWYGCHAILHEYLVFASMIFMFSNLALWLLWLLWIVFSVALPFFTCLSICLSSYLSIQPI